MRIAIDLTPLLPGGANGGAKIMTLQLVKHLAKLEPMCTFILLSSNKNHAELKSLRSKNVKIVNTSNLNSITAALNLKKNGIFGAMQSTLKPFRSSIQKMLSRSVKADLLFCPFTAPYYHSLVTPVVSVIYDLQSHYHSDHFTHEEREERKKNFSDACHHADTLICISDFVRQTVIDNSTVNPDNIKTIYIRLAHRLPKIGTETMRSLLSYHQLKENSFLLYPANFWPHKNHQTLFAAFGLYCNQNPQSTLKLVCTGSDNGAHKLALQTIIRDLGLEERIVMPGFLSDDTFASFMHSCRALIFPSLYEGFGMPTLEAMAHEKPVLCSNLTSLPEIVGSAAILFDPHSPTEIAHAIYRIESETSLSEKLVQEGKDRVAVFGTEMDMAKEYLQIFKDVITNHSSKKMRTVA
jgi:glycosyltransferase involved in cell wall biosynthesis